ncbi:hypothetical protein GCM10029978_089110 [Actinoallomurus acanthiterrae]
MVEPVIVLRPARVFRWAALVLVVAALIVSVLFSGMAMLDHAVEFFGPSLLIFIILVGRPLPVLFGRTTLRAEGIISARSHGKPVTIPPSEVTQIEIRRGWLLEWVFLHRRRGAPVQLYGPLRVWFRRDHSFDQGLAELCSLAGTGAVGRPRFSLRFLIGSPILTAAAVAMVLVEPPWQSDSWPGRSHAVSLPDPCSTLDTIARRFVPGARVDQSFGQASGRRSCQWTETSGGEGQSHDGVGELTVEYELFHRVGWSSDADEARDHFDSDSHPVDTQGAVPVSKIGDEATLLATASDKGDFATAAVVARRWNVVVRVAHTLDGRGKEEEAARTATEAVRSALAAVRFR